MATVNLPNVKEGQGEQLVQNLYDSYYKLRKELSFLLENLDAENVVQAKSVISDWIYAGEITTDQIIAGQAKISSALIDELVVGSNVTMGENARISWNKVDDIPLDLVFADDIQNFATTGYVSTRLGNLLEYSDLETVLGRNYIITGALMASQIAGGTLTTVGWDGTGNSHIVMRRQLIHFKDNELSKMAIGFLPNKDNIKVPIMVLGAGDGYGNNRGYIQKDENALSLYYIDNSGEVSYLSLGSGTANLNGYEVFSKASAITDDYISSASTWNNKLSEEQAKGILENPEKNWDIPIDNFDNDTATKINNGDTAYSYFELGELHAERIKDATITTAKLADKSVNTSKLADLAVEASKLANKSVTATKIANAAIGSAAIAEAAIGSVHIADGAILNAHIEDATITSAKIANLSADKIAAGTINASISINGPTITGGMIRTRTPSYLRFELDSYGLYSMNPNNERHGVGLGTGAVDGMFGNIGFYIDDYIYGGLAFTEYQELFLYTFEPIDLWVFSERKIKIECNKNISIAAGENEKNNNYAVFAQRTWRFDENPFVGANRDEQTGNIITENQLLTRKEAMEDVSISLSSSSDKRYQNIQCRVQNNRLLIRRKKSNGIFGGWTDVCYID